MTFWIKKASLFLSGFFLLLTGLSAHADDNGFSTAQKDVINRMIREYILEHPEILPEAIQILQKRTKREVLNKNHSLLYSDGYSYVGGNKNGDVTLIEFFDYNCGFCKRALGTVERLKKEDPNLRVIYKEFPILSETSHTASKAAMASLLQGKYAAFHKALLKNTGKLTEDRLFEIAKIVGLDTDRLIADMTNPDYERFININHSLAQALEITGTPGFIIGENIIPGAVPYEKLAELIARERQRKK